MAIIENNRVSRIVIILGVLFVVSWIIISTIIEAGKTATIDVLIAPESSKLIIGGKTYSNGTHKIEPGEYVIELSKDGFVTKRENMTFKKDETAQIRLFLLPADGDYSWYESHPDDYVLLDPIISDIDTKNTDEMVERYPLATKLPIRVGGYSGYRIDYGYEDDVFVVYITDYQGGNEEYAKDRIRESGYNPSDYKIIYRYEPGKYIKPKS